MFVCLFVSFGGKGVVIEEVCIPHENDTSLNKSIQVDVCLSVLLEPNICLILLTVYLYIHVFNKDRSNVQNKNLSL